MNEMPHECFINIVVQERKDRAEGSDPACLLPRRKRNKQPILNKTVENHELILGDSKSQFHLWPFYVIL